jgi:glucarate dehydratase
MSYKAGPRIKEIHITPIAIVDPPLLNAAGLHAPYALRTVLEIVTEDNISGISEIPGTKDIDAALEESKKLVDWPRCISIKPNSAYFRASLWNRFGG